MIESFLNPDEKADYNELTNQYQSMEILMSEKSTQIKRRISQYKRDNTEDTYSKVKETPNISSNENTSLLTKSDEIPEERVKSSEAYILLDIENTNDLSDINENTIISGNSDTNLPLTRSKTPTIPTLTSETSYLLPNQIDLIDTLSSSQEDDPSTYKTIQEITTDCNNEENEKPHLHYLDLNSIIPNEIISQDVISDEGNCSSGYISLESANA